MTNKNHDPATVQAAIAALEALVAEPTSVNLVRYSDLALSFLVAKDATGFSITPRREGNSTMATVAGADRSLSYLNSLL